MEEQFDYMFSQAYDNGLSEMFENPLSQEMITDSIERACDFFHIEQPARVVPGDTTGVVLGDTNTYGDEILFFNRAQLENMGLTGQDGLDLVMTHEGTHIMLQGRDEGFNSYQEELCCDYMAGVRAGLNGMEVSQLEDSLRDLPQGLEHPLGIFRVDAVEQGLEFARDYMSTHEQLAPTFDECLVDFKGEDMHDVADLAHRFREIFAEECAMKHYQDLVEREPENETACQQLENCQAKYERAIHEYEERLSTMTKYEGKEDHHLSFRAIDDRAYHQAKAAEAKRWEEWHIRKGNEANDRGDLSGAKSHYEIASNYHKTMKEELDAVKKCTK